MTSSSSSSVNLRDIAEKTGLTRMAVSLALRGKPGVSEQNRKKVLEVAEQLGYRPDPEVAKLLSRIRARNTSSLAIDSCLALLTSGARSDQWKKYPTERNYVEGAIERAGQYGYRLEEFWLGEPSISPSRRSSILWNRGIEGVIIAPLQEKIGPGTTRRIELDYSLFAVVEISETIEWPEVDRTVHDQYIAMQRCIAECTDLQYRRIGFVIEKALDLRVNGKWTAAFLRHRLTAKSPALLPPLLLDKADQAAFDRWFKRHTPDVIISVDQFALCMMNELGLVIPRDVGYASLDIDGDSALLPEVSGIDQNSRQLGAAAVDMLVAAIQRGNRGIPGNPVRTEIEGQWVAGKSLKRQV